MTPIHATLLLRKYAAFALLALAALVPGARAASPADWVLSYEGKSTNRFIGDKRAVGLVRSHVPSALSADVIGGLGGPPDPVFVTARRYLRVSACVAHDCGDKGFFWLDSRTGAGLGAHLGGDVLRLGSKDFTAAQLPVPALMALVDWLTEQQVQPSKVEFIAGDEHAVALARADVAPRLRYQPREGGPSFDCAKAATPIEKAVCGDPALAKSDLEMAELVHTIYQGHDTVGARRQLLDLQRAWLRTRDAECRQAADLPGCLRERYRTQYARLRNWVPRP